MIKSKQLAKVLHELTKDDTVDVSEKFFAFMKAKKLEAQMPSVLYHFEKIIEQEKEKKGIQIEVPHEVSAQTIKDIKEFLQIENLEETIKINKNLLAGFRARYQGKMYDSSLKTGLDKLKEKIISTQA